MSNTYKITIAYEGTKYGGWQVQKNALSIQEVLEKTLQLILQHPCRIHGSGRTDAGVHALGQTAHFTTDKTLDAKKVLLSCNALLPPDIRIFSFELVDPHFHARFSAQGKIYHYRLHTNPIPDPFKTYLAYHVPYPIDLHLLKQGAKAFLGTHDFTSFAHEAHKGSAAVNPMRTIVRLDVVEEEDGIRLEFEADGFLYKMVRNIVGTLLAVANGKIPLDAIEQIFAARNRSLAGQTAPPHGLYLIRVKY